MDIENVDPVTMARIVDLRHGYWIADEVLRDTLSDFARGGIEAEELLLALRQHRAAFDIYTSQLLAVLEPATPTLH